MKVLAIQTSANDDGLTARCAQTALDGAKSAGAEVELVHLNQLEIDHCRACERGWGICRTENRCIIEDDDFEPLRQKMNAADGLVFASPSYFQDISESARTFLDRLRRCEARRKNGSPLADKPIIGIGAAGGSGAGAANTSLTLEMYFRRIGLKIADLFPITRFNADYKLKAIQEAGRRLIAK
jgi:multimeric flavodoxin WrbA